MNLWSRPLWSKHHYCSDVCCALDPRGCVLTWELQIFLLGLSRSLGISWLGITVASIYYNAQLPHYGLANFCRMIPVCCKKCPNQDLLFVPTELQNRDTKPNALWLAVFEFWLSNHCTYRHVMWQILYYSLQDWTKCHITEEGCDYFWLFAQSCFESAIPSNTNSCKMSLTYS